MRRTLFLKLSAGLLLMLLMAPAAMAADGNVLATGEFEGRSDHEVSGGVAILSMGDSVLVVLGSDFSLDGAPDPKVALGKDGYQPKPLLTPLESKEGSQVYELPKSKWNSDFNQVWIWCEKFNVPLGVAALKATAGK